MQKRELIVHVEVPDTIARLVDSIENGGELAFVVTYATARGGHVRVMEVHTEPDEHFAGFFQPAARGER